MDVVGNFLLQVQNVTKLHPNQQPERLLHLLRLHPQANQTIVRLNSLGNLNEEQINMAVEQRNYYNDDWLAFNEVVISFVRLSNQINPWSVLESFDLYAAYLNDMSVAFTNKSKGYLLTPLLQDTIGFVIPLATQLDMQLLQKEAHRKLRLTYIASILLKVFNNIRSQLGAGDHIEAAKKSIILFIGTRLCLIYFRISNPLLCRNVFSNMNNANLIFHNYPKNQQLQYRYFLAKFYIVKYQFVDAYEHLSWCLRNIPENYVKDNENVTKILKELLPVGMILGKKPNVNKFREVFYTSPASCPNFLTLYSEINDAISSGNFWQFRGILSKHHRFLKHHNLALLFSKAFIIILRNLLRKVWVLQGKQPKLNYESIKRALVLSLKDLDLTSVTLLESVQNPMPLDDYVVENCLISLIDQNLLRGKVFPRLRVVSLAKTEVFPSISALNFLKFGNGLEGSLASADKWMSRA